MTHSLYGRGLVHISENALIRLRAHGRFRG